LEAAIRDGAKAMQVSDRVAQGKVGAGALFRVIIHERIARRGPTV
jgi:hypothetical protein